MNYKEAVQMGFTVAMSKLYAQGRLPLIESIHYTDPTTLRREIGYIVTPLRVEWD